MKKSTLRLTLSAMLLALGILLPFVTGQIPQFGKMLLPMHLPVLLCGLICGWKYGLAVGAILPLLRSALFHMPPIYPEAVAMSFELATYGLVIGLIYSRLPKKGTAEVYIALLGAMLAGRIVWGIARAVMMGLGGSSFTWQMFAAGALLQAVPGIILQLLLIPAIMALMKRTKVLEQP